MEEKGVELVAYRKIRFSFNLFPILTEQQKVIFFQNLSSLLASSDSIADSFIFMKELLTSKRQHAMLDSMAELYTRGIQLPVIFSQYRFFSDLEMAIVSVGEQSGDYEEVFRKCGELLARRIKLKGKVQSALLYPAFLLIGVIVMLYVMARVVLPQLGSFLGDATDTNTMLQLALKLGEVPIPVFIISLLAFLALLYVMRSVISKLFFTLGLKIPMTRKLILTFNNLNFCVLYQIMNNVGVLPSEIFRILKLITGKPFSSVYASMESELASGAAIGDIMPKQYFLPNVRAAFIAGQKSGNLDRTLANTVDYLQEATENSRQTVENLVTPVVMLLISSVVGYAVYNIYVPMFQNITM